MTERDYSYTSLYIVSGKFCRVYLQNNSGFIVLLCFLKLCELYCLHYKKGTVCIQCSDTPTFTLSFTASLTAAFFTFTDVKCQSKLTLNKLWHLSTLYNIVYTEHTFIHSCRRQYYTLITFWNFCNNFCTSAPSAKQSGTVRGGQRELRKARRHRRGNVQQVHFHRKH